MVKRISDLHGLGVRVAFDDFGSGYSNLGICSVFPSTSSRSTEVSCRRLADPPMVA